jgi:putative ABC transport system ATP-binding protein
MQIELKQVVPIPLKDRFMQRISDVWNRNIMFDTKDRIKIKAPSGTGKTTLVHCLYKLRNDYEGSILFNNKDIKRITGNDLALLRQNNISIIFQDLRLFPNLTARENIELNRVLQETFYESDKIDEMATRLNIKHVLDQPAQFCSYGEQQRVAIIRSLIQPFNWLIMDEPFSHLDQKNIHHAAELITDECNKRNAGFILTDLEEDDHFNYTKLLNL